MSTAGDGAWRWLETSLLIRRFEETVLALKAEEAFTGHFHVYIGQEATAATAIDLLGKRDHIVSTHRNHGHVLARGADPGRALAEILGRAGGLNRGRAGTFHLCDPERGFLSTSGVVGGCIGLAAGGGYACKQRRDGSVTMAFFGDGSLEEGVSFESLNAAALWRLPVIFVCENNSIDSALKAQRDIPKRDERPEQELLAIPRSVGMRAVRIDGADAEAVHAAASDAIARCRAGDGPVFIEAVTARWPGSIRRWPELVTGATDIAMGFQPVEDGPYRLWFEQHDPVLRLVRSLGSAEPIKSRVRQLDAAVTARMAEARAFALSSPLPDREEAFADVFA